MFIVAETNAYTVQQLLEIALKLMLVFRLKVYSASHKPYNSKCLRKATYTG